LRLGLESDAGGVETAAIAAGEHVVDGSGPRGEQRADAARLLLAALREIELCGAIVDVEIRRIGRAGDVSMAKQDDMAAFAQQRPARVGRASEARNGKEEKRQGKSKHEKSLSQPEEAGAMIGI
jgi:hypothetical protein